MKPEELSLYAEALAEFRENLDAMIRMLVLNLTEKDLETGTISAKIKVNLKKETDSIGQQVYVMGIEPEVGIKIGASGKAKMKEKNGIFLRYRQDGTPIIGGKQMEIEAYIREMEGTAWSA